MKLLFILFPGFGVSKLGWDTNIDDNDKKIKNNFIKEIKKLGDIYYYDPKYHNLNYYYPDYNQRLLYEKDIEFTKKDLDIEYVCDEIYNDVKNFNGKLVLIGHSIGSYFIYTFQKKYYKKCLFNIIIDGAYMGPILKFIHDEDFKNKVKKYKKYTDEDINILREDVYNNDIKSIQKLYDYSLQILLSQYKDVIKANEFKIPTICFYNFRIREENNTKKLKFDRKFNIYRKQEIEHFMKYNNDNYKAITFINKTHFPHFIDDSREIILDYIKIMVDKLKN